MKLNNKGFAISTIMYMILIMAVVLITVTLTLLSSRNLILNKLKTESKDNIYDKPCQVIKGDLHTVGSEIECGGEYFYVMPDHELAESNTVSMLAKYNLNVGENPYPEGKYGVQDKHTVNDKCNSDDCSDVYGYSALSSASMEKDQVVYGIIQNGVNKAIEKDSNKNTVLAPEGTLINTDIIMPHLLYYSNYLTGEVGIQSVTVGLVSYKQTQALKCTDIFSYVLNDTTTDHYLSCYKYVTKDEKGSEVWKINDDFDEKNIWLHNTSFWTDHALSHINIRGNYHFAYSDYEPSKYGPNSEASEKFVRFYGVRPMIIVPIYEIDY